MSDLVTNRATLLRPDVLAIRTPTALAEGEPVTRALDARRDASLD